MARISRFSRKPRFRRFRRKGSGGTWFPTLGTRWGDANPYVEAGFNIDTLSLGESKEDGPNGLVIPVTKDFTQQPSTSSSLTGPSLRDYVEGQEWMLKRIVGSIHVQFRGPDNTDMSDRAQYWQYAQVSAGFFVARAIEGQESDPDLDFAEWDPIALDNIQNPWIWRRTWLLSNFNGNVTRDDFPIANSNYVGDASGPYIDTKVKRKITREKRLWFALTAIGWDGNRLDVQSLGPAQGSVTGLLDIRIFGQMRRGKNNGEF